MTRIPETVKKALVSRDQARTLLRQREAKLQEVLTPFAGATFTVEGVPIKVCGRVGKLYVRRIVGPEETQALREKWRNE